MNNFRSELIKMCDTHRVFEKDANSGIGIRPISVESKIRADLLDSIIKLYDKHFSSKNEEITL